MAQPIALEIPPRNPRADLRSRVERAPEEHAEAVLAAYELLQELHNQGVLDIMRSALAARTNFWRRSSTRQRSRKPFAVSGKFSTGAAFLAASNRNGSGDFRGNSRRPGASERGPAETGSLFTLLRRLIE